MSTDPYNSLLDEIERTPPPAPRVKPGARIEGVDPKLIDFAARRNFTITSGNDSPGVHVRGSRHGRNAAVDLRVRDKTPEEVARAIADARAEGFNVLDETRGRRPHLHLSTGGVPASDPYSKLLDELESAPAPTPPQTWGEAEGAPLTPQAGPPTPAIMAPAPQPIDPLAGQDVQPGEEVVREIGPQPRTPRIDLYTQEGRAERDRRLQAEKQGGALYRVPVSGGIKQAVETIAKETDTPPEFAESWLKSKGLGIYDRATGQALESSPTGFAAIPAEMIGQLREDYRKHIAEQRGTLGVIGRDVSEALRTRSPGELLVGAAEPVAHGAMRTLDLTTRPVQAASAAFWAKVKGADNVQAVKTAWEEFRGEQPELASNLIADFVRTGKIPYDGVEWAKMARGEPFASIDVSKVNPRIPKFAAFLAEMVADPANIIPGGLIAKGATRLGTVGRAGGRIAKLAEGLRDVGIYEPDIPREAFKAAGAPEVLGDLTRRAVPETRPEDLNIAVPVNEGRTAPRVVKPELRTESPRVETAAPEAVPTPERAATAPQASNSPVTETIIKHSDPRIDGGRVIGSTSDGRLRVENNEGGVSIVQHPRKGGNRNAALGRREVLNEDVSRAADVAAGEGVAPPAADVPPVARPVPEPSVVGARGDAPVPAVRLRDVVEPVAPARPADAVAADISTPAPPDRLNAPVPGPRAFRAQMKKAFNLDDTKADEVLATADAFAGAWAKVNGKRPEDWYQRFGGIERGGEGGPGALNQAAHKTPQTPEFRRWSQDAPVVEQGHAYKTGEPVVVKAFHGTREDFTKFSASRAGQNTQKHPGRSNFFLSDNPENAGGFATGSKDAIEDFHPADRPNVMPVYLRMTNPLVVDAEGKSWYGIMDDSIARARKAGHDGLIVRNVRDLGDMRRIGAEPTTTLVAFKPEQIKSATGNRGTFGPADPNILRQENKAAVEFMKDGRAILRAFQKADVSSAWHEMAHVFRRDLPENLLKDAEEAIGVKTAPDGSWPREAEEKFARGFERYLKTGEAPNIKLRRVFERAEIWLTEIYKAVRGKNHPLNFKPNEKLTAVFDRMLGGEPKGEYGQLIHQLHKAPDVGTPAFFENAQVKRALGLKADASTADVRAALTEAVGKPRSSHLTPDDVRGWADSKGLQGAARVALDDAIAKFEAKKVDTVADAGATPESLAPADSLADNDPQFIESYYAGKTTDAEFTQRAREAGLSRAEVRAVIADARETRSVGSGQKVSEGVRAGKVEGGRGAGRNREGDVDVLYQADPVNLPDEILNKQVRTISLRGDELGDASVPLNELRKRAFAHARANYQGRPVRNEDKGWDIAISRKGLSHTMHHSAQPVFVRSMVALPELLRKAVWIGERPNTDAASLGEVSRYHTFYAPLEVGGQLYRVKMKVAETVVGKKFYDHRLTEIERPADSPTAATEFKTGPTAGSSAGAEYTIRQLVGDINDPDILFQSSESEVLRRFREVTARTRTGEAKRLEERIADLERRIEEKDFTPADRPQPRAITAEVAQLRARRDELRKEYEALNRTRPVQGPKITDARKEGPRPSERTGPLPPKQGPKLSDAPKEGPKLSERVERPTFKDQLADVANAPRSLKSSIDLSASMRQGAMFTLTHPVRASKIFFGKQLKSLSNKGYESFVKDLKADPDVKAMQGAGLHLTSLAPDRIGQREEAFASKLAGKVPLVQRSEHAYVTFLDAARSQWFKQLKTQAEDAAKKSGRPVTKEQYETIAKFINRATGRGDLGKGALNDAAPLLNSVFFAPRYAISKVQVFDPRMYAQLPPGARRMALRQAAQYFATIGATALLLKEGFGAEVGTDPEQSDFLKVRVGNTRYDLAAGQGQYVTLAARLLREADNNRKGEDTKVSRILDRFTRYKYAPVPAAIRNVWEGKDAIGKKTNVGREALNLVTPIYLTDLYEAFKQEGMVGVGKNAPGFIGIGVQTYEDKPLGRPNTGRTVRRPARASQ